MTVDVYPSTWSEAAAHAGAAGAVVIAGGTGVQPWLSVRTDPPPTALIHLARVPEARQWDCADGTVTLGALVTVDNPAAAICFGSEGAGWFATPAVRRRATVVGNVVSALGPRELGAPLLALDAHLHGRTDTSAPWTRSIAEILRDGMPTGHLATAITANVPERIVYHRMSSRRRLSRIELGVCGAQGRVSGASVVVGATVLPVDAEVAHVDEFVAAVQTQATTLICDPRRLATVTELAARVHRDLHTRTET